ncbi:hypothetical protein FPV47_11375 [Vibrio cholerae]|uniref:hypothetical protein n=1 Tax=Vibrio cholerae TaxID=666 RepID=UPI00005F4AFC|nr:hypothetical protein [Vibrio cholerae]EGU18045.1 para-aminobenzoate synthase glutamine amidotransferase component II [Vibrio mimicus SX-4]APF62270.1 para-aminobenzoate synthase glutamine amidotransferase component II [Vibrio cholerae]APF62275.1 para-aminobenzoate synthase glutamine amidotransferase component II [Vibrio cholerae]EGQ7979920.1 hypothetical protein [Vibrio cholerae]EGQ8141953.1 hypothetical protein [Vibrio cholerae]
MLDSRRALGAERIHDKCCHPLRVLKLFLKAAWQGGGIWLNKHRERNMLNSDTRVSGSGRICNA